MKCSRCDSLSASERVETFKIVVLCDQCWRSPRLTKPREVEIPISRPFQKAPRIKYVPVEPEPEKPFRYKEGSNKEIDYGCAFLVDIKDSDGNNVQIRCGQTPAFYWIECQCPCECSERVCVRHSNRKCQCTHSHHTPGSSIYIREEIGPWQENAIRALEGDI